MRFFHRYRSTIHGNYRKAYLRCGLITGVLLMFYILVRYMMRTPAESPEAYLTDGILLLSIFLFTLLYRNTLPDRLATMKELMLFGMGTAVLASLLYGLFLWGFGCAAPEQTVLFTYTLSGKEISGGDLQLHYWAALWAIVAGVKLAVLGGFGAFISAVILRNEKGEVRKEKMRSEN